MPVRGEANGNSMSSGGWTSTWYVVTSHHDGSSFQDTDAAPAPASSTCRSPGAGGTSRATVARKDCTAARCGFDVSSLALTVMVDSPARTPRSVNVSEERSTLETSATSEREVVRA